MPHSLAPLPVLQPGDVDCGGKCPENQMFPGQAGLQVGAPACGLHSFDLACLLSVSASAVAGAWTQWCLAPAPASSPPACQPCHPPTPPTFTAQVFLLLACFVAVPWMLLPKPLILKKRHEARLAQVCHGTTGWLAAAPLLAAPSAGHVGKTVKGVAGRPSTCKLAPLTLCRTAPLSTTHSTTFPPTHPPNRLACSRPPPTAC